MTRHDADAFDTATDDFRWSSGHELNRVASGTIVQEPETGTVAWPSAIYPAGDAGYNAISHHGQLTLNALLAPDLPRPMNWAWTKWPGWQYVWPGALATGWSGFGFWAHSEPLHPLFAAGFGLAGTALMALGALGIAASNTGKRDAEDHPADTAGTRALLGLGGAAWAGASASGAGFSGIGCMLAFGSLGAAYLAASGWKQLRRHNAIRAVIDYASASNPGPLPSGGLPFPPIALPDNRLPANPYEHRLQKALSAMRIEGTWFGSPMKVAEDTWRLPFELPAGANLSPEKLAKKEDVLANNTGARRIEVDPTHGPRGTFTIYDGPDRTDETYPWNGVLIKSVEKPFLIAYDEAGRPTEIDFTEHIMLTGRTRLGKSALMRYLLVATIECDIVRFGVDCKDGAPGFGMLEPVFHELATDPIDAWRQHFGIKGISAARGQWMRRKDIDKWDLADGPRILQATDELAEMVLRTPDATEIIKSNLSLVAASAITYLLATQSPSRAVFGKNTDARKQIGVRIGFKNDIEANNMVFGGLPGYRTQDLDAAGKLLIASLEHQRPRRHKAVWMDRDPALALMEQYDGRMPKLDSMSLEGYLWGQQQFDEAMAQGLNPLESFEPPPSGGGGRRADSFVDTAQAEQRRRSFRLVTNYPGTDEPIELKHLALWNLLGQYGADGAVATDLVEHQLDGFTSESWVRKQLKEWLNRGYIEAVKDGRPNRFWRPDVVDELQRKDA